MVFAHPNITVFGMVSDPNPGVLVGSGFDFEMCSDPVF